MRSSYAERIDDQRALDGSKKMDKTPATETTARLEQASAALRPKLDNPPRVGLVLGSGLAPMADGFEHRVPYSEIPGMPTPSVVGHTGELCFGDIRGVPVACLVGRAHLYEGRTPAEVTFGSLLLRALGCERVLLTNAAGGLNPAFQPGDLMLITDHMNFTGQNPLVGPELPWGTRFPDMGQAYDPGLRDLAGQAAECVGVTLQSGVYASVLGPSYETPAEIRAFSRLGADAIGMSTVLETIALHHAGVKVAAMSCITNLAAGVGDEPLSHADVTRIGRESAPRCRALLEEWVYRIGQDAS